MTEQGSKRLAVVLLQLGGPDSLDAVKPYLLNFFRDPAIIGAPLPIRWMIAQLIASRRAPITREIYAKLGNKSPILEQTQAQAAALTEALTGAVDGFGEVRSFIAMRYWHPFAAATAAEVKAWDPDEIVVLPLYPQFSTTTTGSAIRDWQKAAGGVGLRKPTHTVCCYPTDPGFVAAQAALIRAAWPTQPDGVKMRILMSAHGLPVSIVEKGDPYAWQAQKTAQTLFDALDMPDVEWRLTFQSRVTPQEWLKPDTEDEVKQAGTDGVGLMIVPIVFVSEHSETLVELDDEYREIAEEHGVPLFARAPTVQAHPVFVASLARLVTNVVSSAGKGETPPDPICPRDFGRCGCREVQAIGSETWSDKSAPWSIWAPTTGQDRPGERGYGEAAE